MNLSEALVRSFIDALPHIMLAAIGAVIFIWGDVRSLKSARKRAFKRIEALEAKVFPRVDDKSGPTI